MKRELFHSPKYPSIVGTITTSAVNTSEPVGFQTRAFVSLSRANLSKPRMIPTKTFASGEHLAELDLPVAVEIDFRRRFRDKPRVRAPQRRLEQRVEEVSRAGAAHDRPARSG